MLLTHFLHGFNRDKAFTATRSSTPPAQLDAYNAKDLDLLLDTYASDAAQYTLHGELLPRVIVNFETSSAFLGDSPNAYSSDRERTFHMIVNSHVMWAAGVDVLR